MAGKDVDTQAALDALIRQTIAEMGSVDPVELPHHIRRRLSDQALGKTALDERIRAVVAEQQSTKTKTTK